MFRWPSHDWLAYVPQRRFSGQSHKTSKSQRLDHLYTSCMLNRRGGEPGVVVMDVEEKEPGLVALSGERSVDACGAQSV